MTVIWLAMEKHKFLETADRNVEKQKWIWDMRSKDYTLAHFSETAVEGLD